MGTWKRGVSLHRKAFPKAGVQRPPVMALSDRVVLKWFCYLSSTSVALHFLSPQLQHCHLIAFAGSSPACRKAGVLHLKKPRFTHNSSSQEPGQKEEQQKVRNALLAYPTSGTIVTQYKDKQCVWPNAFRRRGERKEVGTEQQGRKDKQGGSVSQHRWQQAQQRSLAAAKWFAGFSAQPRSERSQEGGKDAAPMGQCCTHGCQLDGTAGPCADTSYGKTTGRKNSQYGWV